MSKSDEKLAMRALAFGALTGLRSMSGVAAFSQSAGKDPDKLKDTPFAPLASSTGQLVTLVAAAGEIVMDKLPLAGSRTKPLPLLARIATGATVGAGVYSAAKSEPWTGAIIGGTGALLFSFVGYFYRVGAHKLLKLPDLIWALGEDAAAVALGKWLVDEKQ